jgi:hypothetical protein
MTKPHSELSSLPGPAHTSPLGQSAGFRRASSQTNDWSLVLAT